MIDTFDNDILNDENDESILEISSLNVDKHYSEQSFFLNKFQIISYTFSDYYDKLTKSLNDSSDVDEFFLNINLVYKTFLLDLVFYLLLIFQYSKIISDLEQKFNDVDMIEGFGLTNSILHLTLLPLYYGLGNIYAIIGSQAYSVKKYFLYDCIKNQTRLFGYLLTTLLAIVLLKFFPIYSKIFDLNDEVISFSSSFLFFRIISFYFEIEVYISILHCQMVENYMSGIVAILSNFFIFSFLSNWFIGNAYVDAVTGVGMTYILSNSFILVILHSYNIMFDIKVINENNNNNHHSLTLDCKEIVVDTNSNKFKSNIIVNILDKITEFIMYCDFLLKSYQIYFSYFNMITLSFFDILSAELISLIAAYLTSKDYSSYILVSTIYGMISTINMAMAVCVNVILGNFIGKNNVLNVKKYFCIILLINNIIVISIGIVTYLFGDILLSCISNSEELINNTKQLVIFTVIINIQDATFSVLLNTLKTLNMYKISLNCMVIYNIINFIIMYIFAFKLDLGVKGLYYGYISSDIIILTYLIYFFYYNIDWNYQISNSIQESEKNEDIIVMLEKKILKSVN